MGEGACINTLLVIRASSYKSIALLPGSATENTALRMSECAGKSAWQQVGTQRFLGAVVAWGEGLWRGAFFLARLHKVDELFKLLAPKVG